MNLKHDSVRPTIAHLVSVQIGQPKVIDDGEQPWTSSFFREPTTQPVQLTKLGIVGDEVADKKHHGGIDKAVLIYSADHWEFWEREIGSSMPNGGFGENLTVQDAVEGSVCIGDRWSVGEVVLEVSQPRQPCWKLGRRWSRSDLPKLVVQTRKSGWYARVIQEGLIQSGQPMKLQERHHPDWSVARANQVFYGNSPQDKAELATLPPLADVWKRDLPA